MIKRKFYVVMLFTLIAILFSVCAVFFTACGGNTTSGGGVNTEQDGENPGGDNEPDEYTVTFVADGVTVSTGTYTETDKTITEPVVPEKDGYTGEWENYTLTTGNIIVSAVYTPIEYKITFIAEGKTVSTDTYTVEDKDITEPAIPVKDDYSGTWENYTLTTGDITVEAVYTPMEYSIVFKADGKDVDTVKYTVEDKNIVEPSVPVKVGYTGEWENYAVTSGNLTVNAVYTAIEYTVIFMDGDTVIGTDTYTVEDKDITVPAVPQKTGYLSKWEDYTLTTGNVVIDVEYDAVEYKIVYQNTKDASNQNPEVYTIESPTIQLHGLKADGYDFVGWYYNGEIITEIPQGSTGEISLTAKWNIITYTITYNYDTEKGDYAHGDSNEPQYTIEDEIVLSSLESNTEGYVFVGWEDETTGEIVTKIEEGSFGNKVLTAVFEVSTFTVTWKNYDGTILKTDTNVKYNTLPVYSGETPTKERDTQSTYNFIGWMPVVEKVTEDATYVAQFEADLSSTYQIRYDAKGGQNVPSIQTKQHGTSINLSSVIPVNDGHVFLGWYCAYNDKTYDAGEKFALDLNVTLYAVWGHTCDICNGSGQNNTDQITCTSCHGTGKTSVNVSSTCIYCGGSGHSGTTTQYVSCSSCKGFGGRVLCQCSCGWSWWADQTGSRICSRCGRSVSGQRITTCSTCSGTGTVKKTVNLNCSYCGGDGKISQTVERSCSNCGGKGYNYRTETCWKCDGEKYLKDEALSYTVTLKNEGNIFNTETVVYGDPYKLPIPTKNGYTFVGWFDAPENGAQVTDGYGISLNVWDAGSNKTLYAYWSLNYYTIVYNCDEYVDLDGLPTYYTVEGVPFDLPIQVREHYDFCWQINGETVTRIDPSLAKDLTIQAVWTRIQYQINYNLDGGTAENPEYYDVETNDFALVKPTKTGYTFIGWTGANGEVPQKQVTVIAAEGGNLEFIANWQVNQYTITFESNGGSEIAAVTQDFGTPVFAPDAPIWEGKSFIGWYTDDTWTTEYEFTTMPAENITLYARWNDYEITIESDEIAAISINDDILSPELYHAAAIDTDGNVIPITVEILGGSQVVGDTITVRLTAKGLYGVTNTKILRDIRVYGNPTLTYDLDKDYFSLSDTLNAELWQASAIDTYGETIDVVVSVKEADYEAGDFVTIILSATDVAGNTSIQEIADVKVYGLPVITRNEDINSIKADDEIGNELFGVSAVDSFGEPLTVVTELYSGIQEGGSTITVKSSAVDGKGNSYSITYLIDVYDLPVISNATTTAFKVEDEITLSALGISAADSFGETLTNVTLELVDGVQTAGSSLTFLVTAVDHLGNTQTREINNIRVYGTPVISYDTGKLAISVTDVINDRLFKATAKDSFDAPIDVSVELENGTIAGGNVVTFRLSAVDALGNMCSVVTDRIKVYSADDIELVYNKAASTRIRKISHGEEFEAAATNSFGEACAISIVAADGYVLEGGNIINLYIVATDALGNFVQSELITGIRVYDMPTLSFAREYGYIQKSDSPYALFSLHDSFGTEVTTTITVVSGSLDDETVTYKITGTDRAGNSFEQDYELVVLDIDESILELYKNGEKIGTQRVTKGESFSLPCNIGYYTVWYLNGVAITDNMGSSLSAWANDSNGYIVTAIPVPITYSIQYDMGGGTNSSFNPSAYNIENSTITLSHPTRTGYTFIGWTGTGLAEREMNVVISAGSYGDRTYTAHWQANSYTVSLDANGGEVSFDTLQVTYDATYNLPVPSRTGYTFAGWFADEILYSGGIWRVADDVELIASWTPNTDTVYTVNHYWQNITDDEYTLYETETLRGTTDTSVTPSTEMYTGFTAPQAQTVNVDPDGSRIVNYYYTRNYYTVTVVGNGGTNNTITQKYQSVIDTTNWTTRDGYTLGGLYTDLSLTTLYTDKTMPAENKTVYAYWTGENVASDFEYTSGTNGITITGYTGISTIVKIPEQIGGRDVVAIAASAFANQTNLTSVVVPDSVESIGLGAFKGCDSLESISLPFVGASRDAEVYNGVFGYIFGYTTKVRNYNNYGYLDSTEYKSASSTEYVNTQYSSVSGATWQYSAYDCYDYRSSTIKAYVLRSYFYYIPTTLTSVVITDATVIPVAAFNGCANITSVVLNDKVETIEEYAFQNCTGLVSADIGVGLTEIGTYAFYNCTSLESIVVPSGVTTISSYAFYNNTALASVSLPSGMTAINSYAFYNTTGLKELVFPSELQSIGSYAFYGTRIRELNIPGEVTSIGSHAFDGDVALTSLTIPGNVTSIGSYAFSGCENITTLTLESGIETIGDYAFQNLKVTSVVVPDSVESIGVGAFKGCDSLESISLPFVGASRDAEAYNGVFGYIFGYTTKVRNYNNYGYLDSTEYKSASSTEYVNTQYSSVSGATWQYSAYDCYDYRSSTIKAYVLRSYFYYIPTTLTSVVITDATVIPVAAFNGCANITSVVLNDKVETIEEYAFQNCTGLVSADIGVGLTEIGTYAFYNCTSLESIVVPYGVNTMESYVFANCSSLSIKCQIEEQPSDWSSTWNSSSRPVEWEYGCERGVTADGVAWISIDGVTVRIIGYSGSASTLTIPTMIDGKVVNRIAAGAFDGNSTLVSIIIPEGILYVESDAFANITTLTTVTIADSVVEIADGAFSGCVNTSFLCEVAAKPTGWSASWKNSNCAIVWDYAGASGSSEDGFLWAQLSDGSIIIYGYVGSNDVIAIPTGIDGKNVTSISENAFRGNTGITSVFIPKCIDVIGSNAFTGCSNLTINCEIASQPSGWSSNWKDSGTTVYWSM